MSISPTPVPRPEDQSDAEYTLPGTPVTRGNSRMLVILVAALMIVGSGALYLYNRSLSDRLDLMQRSLQASLNAHGQSLQQLTLRLDQTDTRHAELQGEFTVTKQRVGMTQSELQRARQIAADLARQQKESAEQLAGQLGQLQQEQATTQGSLGSLSSDVVGVKGEVKTTQQELETTRSELKRVIGDLGVQSDLIARNRGELEDLRQRGERDYVEFDLRKASKRQRVGNIQLELKRTDEKRQKYTINLIADDRTIEKKDKTVFEPVQFYRVGERQPTEIVIQQIFRDRIVGYVSAPKKLGQRPSTTSG